MFEEKVALTVLEVITARLELGHAADEVRLALSSEAGGVHRELAQPHAMRYRDIAQPGLFPELAVCGLER
jgi:hypothetical protein